MFGWYRRLAREVDWFIQEHIYGNTSLVKFERNKYDLYKHGKLRPIENISSKTEIKVEKGLVEKTN